MAYKLIADLSEGKENASNSKSRTDTHRSGMHDDLIKAFENQPSNTSDYLSHFAQGAKEFAKDVPAALASGVTSFLDVPGNALKGAIGLYGKAVIPKEQREKQQLEGHWPTFEGGLESLVGKENLTPKTEAGKHAKEFAQTVGTVLFPLPGIKGAGLAKTLKGAGAGQAAKIGGKAFGLSEESGEGLKTLTMLGYNLLGKDGLQKQAGNIRDYIKEQLPKSKKFQVPEIANEIKHVRDNFINIGAQPFKGRQLPSAAVTAKPVVDNLLGQLEIDAKNGISYPQLQAWKESLSDQIHKFKVDGNKQAAKYLTNVANKVKDSIENNPEIPKNLRSLYKESNQIFTHVKQFEKIKDYIMDHKGKAAGLGTLALVGLGAYKPEKIFPAIAGTLGVAAAAKVGHQALGIFTKPGVAKALGRTFAAASKENVAQFARNVKIYNDEVNKEVAKLPKSESAAGKKRYKVIASLA